MSVPISPIVPEVPTSSTADLPAYLTTEEVATTLRVDVETVRRWLRSGQLPAVKQGRVYRIRREDALARER